MSDDLEIGTTLVTAGTFGIRLHKITSTTATTYVCDTGTKFRKQGLRIVGASDWGPRTGRVASDLDLVKVRIIKAQDAIRCLVVTAENLAHVEAAIRKIRKPG